MNKDINKIFEGYQQIVNEQPVEAPAAEPQVAEDPMAQVEQLFASGPGADAETLQQQVAALSSAEEQINGQIQQLGLERDRVMAMAQSGTPVEQHMDPATGEYRVVGQIQQLNQQITRLSQLAQTIVQPAQQAGVDVGVLMESLQRSMSLLQEHTNWYVKHLVPGSDGASLIRRHDMKQVILEASTPSHDEDDEEDEEVEEGLTAAGREYFDADDDEDTDDPNYLRDVLGYEPEDFESEDPDQAAMDRNDVVDLANHDRPAAPDTVSVPEWDMIERLLDDETRAVMEDEDGKVTRREAREIAKDILKRMIEDM
jgi:hypothetical protein